MTIKRFYSVAEGCCCSCGFDPSFYPVGKTPYDFCPPGYIPSTWFGCVLRKKLLLGTKNGVDVTVGETLDINPAGFENCATLHNFIRWLLLFCKSHIYHTPFQSRKH